MRLPVNFNHATNQLTKTPVYFLVENSSYRGILEKALRKGANRDIKSGGELIVVMFKRTRDCSGQFGFGQ